MAPLSELVRSRVIRQRPIGWALHPKHGYTLQRIQKTSTELRRTAKGSPLVAFADGITSGLFPALFPWGRYMEPPGRDGATAPAI
jgi:hypothetical protein